MNRDLWHTEIRKCFPNLDVKISGKPLTYLDSAATTLKPQKVIDRITQYYSLENANVHRGSHFLSDQATAAYEAARARVINFLRGGDRYQAVFTRGTTESINLVAQGFAKRRLTRGDRIILTEMEHHSNIVPWQMVAREAGLELDFLPVNTSGDLDLEKAIKFIENPRAKLISVTHVSNTLGTINGVERILKHARHQGLTTVVDGAQAVAHMPVDVNQVGADFYAFSAHKIYGPTGIGVLLGRLEKLEEVEPVQGGGGMIDRVTQERTTFGYLPARLEAGTPHIEGAVGLAAALDFVSEVGLERIEKWESHLTQVLVRKLEELKFIDFVGRPQNRAGIVSFNLKGAHHADVGTILNEMGVAVRVGHHCTQPLMESFALKGTVRASLGVYNEILDIERLVAALEKARTILG